MKGKKGLTDKLISFISFLIIVVASAGFVILATQIYLFKDASDSGDVFLVQLSEQDVLFQPLQYEIEGSQKSSSVIDSIIYSGVLRKKISLTQEKISSGISVEDRNALFKNRDFFLREVGEIRKALKEKIAQNSLQIEEEICFIIVTSPIDRTKLLNPENIYFKAKNGVVEEKFSPRDSDEVFRYDEKKYLVNLPSIKVENSEIEEGLVFEIKYYYGECKNDI